MFGKREVIVVFRKHEGIGGALRLGWKVNGKEVSTVRCPIGVFFGMHAECCCRTRMHLVPNNGAGGKGCNHKDAYNEATNSTVFVNEVGLDFFKYE